ncbi:hypothetical protein [Lactobacillus delbrueckii]|uniref:hypothetical protein n=1 Tax=Lactobacillus delbrueckii TaxID=1584 RepID=UPI0014864D59|nr:hypothetical protein [Lactobacillus delbrueckii]MCD5436132.1 hypothetical protein [Lactobacillus delbrueckii subsp. lactis]MCD5542837.1 hypothetical protein [Lactobacillus delbrueckii subsp. lactis]
MVEIRRGLERGVAKRSRRSDVFSDLIERNDYQGVYRKKKAEIQRILKNYTIMDAKTRKALQDFGFRIEEDGKHSRLTFFEHNGGQDAKRCPRREEYRALY